MAVELLGTGTGAVHMVPLHRGSRCAACACAAGNMLCTDHLVHAACLDRPPQTAPAPAAAPVTLASAITARVPQEMLGVARGLERAAGQARTPQPHATGSWSGCGHHASRPTCLLRQLSQLLLRLPHAAAAATKLLRRVERLLGSGQVRLEQLDLQATAVCLSAAG